MNEVLALLSNTEFAEDDVQDILDIDPTKQAPEGISGGPQIFGREFLALSDDGQAAL